MMSAANLLLARAQAATEQPASASWVGLSLSAAISRLVASGVPVVYSSHVERPEMTVQHEPQASSARAILDEILAPHGLQAREMASGRIVIIRGPASTPSAPAEPRTVDPPVSLVAPQPLAQAP